MIVDANKRCFCRIPAKSYQGFPLKNALACIESENGGGDSSNIGNGFDESPLQPEIVGPFVLSWIQEPDEFTGVCKDGSDVRSFVAITE